MNRPASVAASGLRIAVVSNTAWNLFNFRLNLMRQFQLAGHSVVGVAPGDAFVDKLKAAGIEFEPVPISTSGVNPLVELLAVWRLRSIFKRQKVDLVLSYTPKGNLYAALASMALGIPFVPNVSGLGRAFIHRSPVTLAVLGLYRLTFRRAYRVFFQNLDDLSIFVRAGMVKHADAERLPGSGVDLARFSPEPAPAADDDAPVFLLVARMLWDKGVGEYVTAARSVRQRFPNARFGLLGGLACGNPSAISPEQVDEWVKEGVVTYLGSTEDVRPFVAQADCVVLPSYREGVPRVLLEAAAMARPLITTDAPGCRDAVRHGETGFVCGARSASDLAEKMHSFIALTKEQRHAMGCHGRAFVEANFDEQLVLDRYHQVVTAFATSQQAARPTSGTFIKPSSGVTRA